MMASVAFCRPSAWFGGSGCVGIALLRRSFSAKSTPPNTYHLYSEIIEAEDTSKSILMLHGLLGNGRNLKTLAKQLSKQRSNPAILLDLRGHGKSLVCDFESTNGSSDHNFDACAHDVEYSLSQMNEHSMPSTVLGHSWGGRVALQLAARAAERDVKASSIDQLWLLDTVPGQANESVEQVISTIEKLQGSLKTEAYQSSPPSRTEMTKILSEEYKLAPSLSQWLASTYDAKTLSFKGFDLEVVRSLMPNFQRQDFYGLLSKILEGSSDDARVHLVRGGKNEAWTPDILRELEDLQRQHPGQFFLHSLPRAGHWVHVDDLKGLLKLM